MILIKMKWFYLGNLRSLGQHVYWIVGIRRNHYWRTQLNYALILYLIEAFAALILHLEQKSGSRECNCEWLYHVCYKRTTVALFSLPILSHVSEGTVTLSSNVQTVLSQ